jgi:hypothetical protein
MRLLTQSNPNNATQQHHALVAQPEEIAAIQWMSIDDFCNQDLWQASPLYKQLNEACRRAHERHVWAPATLPVGFRNMPSHITNTLYGLFNNDDPETCNPKVKEELKPETPSSL